MKQKIWMLTASVIVLLSSCRKKDDPVTPAPAAKNGNLAFAFKSMVGSSPLVLNNATYVNAMGDSFTVKTFNYYISNVKLVADDGTTFTEPESYHLVCSNVDSTLNFAISNVPFGNYTSIVFMIGVDSLHNVSGAQTGALDPGKGMFWAWDTGYIMAKFEGVFIPSVNSSYPVTQLIYHIGGYKGSNSTLRTVQMQLPQAAIVQKGRTPVINMNADLAEWFKTPSTIDFTSLTNVMKSGRDAEKVSENYADMFSIDHIDN